MTMYANFLAVYILIQRESMNTYTALRRSHLPTCSPAPPITCRAACSFTRWPATLCNQDNEDYLEIPCLHPAIAKAYRHTFCGCVLQGSNSSRLQLQLKSYILVDS